MTTSLQSHLSHHKLENILISITIFYFIFNSNFFNDLSINFLISTASILTYILVSYRLDKIMYQNN